MTLNFGAYIPTPVRPADQAKRAVLLYAIELGLSLDLVYLCELCTPGCAIVIRLGVGFPAS